jgi:CubicO group peptidase (beta-lactamase class C family)
MMNFLQLEQLITEAMATAKVPGASVAVIHHNEVIYARGFGVTSVEDGGLPCTPTTLFRIGSTSKPLTTAAIMRLVEQGVLELDTSIDELLPDLQLSEPGAIQQVTLRKLLSHQAALPTAAEHWGSRAPEGLRESVYRDVANYRLIAPVGKLWSYSNPGINLAGYVAEVASGKPYTQLMQELVFDPLAMQRTTFDPLVAMTYPLAQSHDFDETGTLRVQHRYADNTQHYPSGFAISTVLDLANFAIMVMQGGVFNGQQVLSAESVAEMQNPQASFIALNGDGYGLTLSSHDYKGVRRIGHGGRISTFASLFEMVPERGTAVIVLSNRAAEWGPQEEKIARFVFDSLLDLPASTPAPQTLPPNPAHWPRLTGIYAGLTTGMATITVENDALMLEWEGQKQPLQAVRDDLYIAQLPGQEDPFTVGFMLEGDTPAEYLNVLPIPGHSVPLQRLALDPAYQPNLESWAAYTGTYSDGTFSFEVVLEDGELRVKSSLFPAPLPARDIGANRILLPFGLITFELPHALRLGTSMIFNRQTEH